MKANVFRGVDEFGVEQVERPRQVGIGDAVVVLDYRQAMVVSLVKPQHAYAPFGDRRGGVIQLAIHPSRA